MNKHLPETNTQRIAQIVTVLKPQVFEELDGKKAKMGHETEYDDSKWNYKVSKNLNDCRFSYNNKAAFLGDMYRYYPFRLENYENGSSEYEAVESMRYEDDAIKKAVMETLLREWCKKEEAARSQKRINERVQHMKVRLNESKAVADACGISVDTVLMIELADKIDILSEDIRSFVNRIHFRI